MRHILWGPEGYVTQMLRGAERLYSMLCEPESCVMHMLWGPQNYVTRVMGTIQLYNTHVIRTIELRNTCHGDHRAI
jgi:hypothetical protein